MYEFTLYFTILLVAIPADCNHSSPSVQNLCDLLIEEQFVPHIFNACPTEICQVTFKKLIQASKKPRRVNTTVTWRPAILQDYHLNPGDYMKSIDTVVRPEIHWNADDRTLYTLSLIGCSKFHKLLHPTLQPLAFDQHYPQIWEWINWLIVNIPGKNITAGNKILRYLPPGQPYWPEVKNRLAFLIYKQSSVIDHPAFHENNSMYEFPDEFEWKEFSRMHNLGEPIAANVFFTVYNKHKYYNISSSNHWAQLVKQNTTFAPTTLYATDKIPAIKNNILNIIKNYSAKYFAQ